MRLHIRDQLLELLATIREGVKFALKAPLRDAQEMLLNCMTCCDAVVSAMKSGFTPETFQTYEGMAAKLKASFNGLDAALTEGAPTAQINEQIKKQIRGIRTELSQEKEVKLEILFLPYKTSMWDSLESIWRAAAADDTCDVYVVPIPYYVAGENGMFQEMKYEGEGFPEEVPILHYSKYDIAARHPDIIYIHNPYDDTNTLTRVPAKYFSSVLKEQTELLVYSPYFVYQGFASDPAKDYFSFTPAMRNADILIAQSNRAAEHWVKCGRQRKNILSYGSPKIDAVAYHTQPGNSRIPDEWKPIIEGKKVFLFNSGIFNFDKGKPDFSIHMMFYMMNLFASNQDAAVIWRPHPLALPGMKRYHSGLYDLYCEQIKAFQSKENTIYDTQPDYTPSFAVADAFISQPSSLIVNFFSTGKPIYLWWGKPPQDGGEPLFNYDLLYYALAYEDTPLFDVDGFAESHLRFKRIAKDLFPKVFPNYEAMKGLYGPDMDWYTNGGFDCLAFNYWDFMGMILGGKDPLREMRQKALADVFPNTGYCAGDKIHEELKGRIWSR